MKISNFSYSPQGGMAANFSIEYFTATTMQTLNNTNQSQPIKTISYFQNYLLAKVYFNVTGIPYSWTTDSPLTT
jgi:hypothetical protein